jgi:hypothetical protein
MEVADGEGDGVLSRWLKITSPAHQMMGEGHMCIEVEVEASALVSAMRGPATSPSAKS